MYAFPLFIISALMKPRFRPLPLVVIALLVLMITPNRAQACADFDTMVTQLAGPGKVTKTATTSGPYSAASTWGGGSAPTATDVAVINAGVTVTVNNLTPTAKTIVVYGTLKFSTTINSNLRVENLLIYDGGRLIVGGYSVNGEGGPVPANLTASIVIFKGPTAEAPDSRRMGRGIVGDCNAIIRMNGAGARTPFTTLTFSEGPSSTPMQTVTAAPADWKIGDEVVIPATVFTREWSETITAAGTAALKNELRTITAINTTAPFSLTLNSHLTYQHLRANSDPRTRLHLANLTRNITIKSESPTDIASRGHVMLMGGDAKITGVSFMDLGRTDKREIVSDPKLATSQYNAPRLNLPTYKPYSSPFIVGGENKLNNPRARYALHFHENLFTTKAIVSKCVVRGTPGWGFANHSSWVDFTDNVCFDFGGAGFAAEDGDEIGAFSGNIAIGGTGNGEFPGRRTVFGNKPRMDQGDMGFTGEGFWSQSPDVTITGNIAAGCKGCGYQLWCGGHFDPASGHITGRPLNRALPAGVVPRHWDWNQNGGNDAVVTTDMPFAAFNNNIAYGCYMGLKMRFVNHGSTAIFTAVRSDPNVDNPVLLLGDQLVPKNSSTATRVRFSISNCSFWNNMNGIHATYVTMADFSNIYIAAQNPPPTHAPATAWVPGPMDEGVGSIGLDFDFQNTLNTLTNVEITNYTTGVWRHGLDLPVTGLTMTGCTELYHSEIDANNNPTNCAGYNWLKMNFGSNNIPDYIR